MRPSGRAAGGGVGGLPCARTTAPALPPARLPARPLPASLTTTRNVRAAPTPHTPTHPRCPTIWMLHPAGPQRQPAAGAGHCAGAPGHRPQGRAGAAPAVSAGAARARALPLPAASAGSAVGCAAAGCWEGGWGQAVGRALGRLRLGARLCGRRCLRPLGASPSAALALRRARLARPFTTPLHPHASHTPVPPGSAEPGVAEVAQRAQQLLEHSLLGELRTVVARALSGLDMFAEPQLAELFGVGSPIKVGCCCCCCCCMAGCHCTVCLLTESQAWCLRGARRARAPGGTLTRPRPLTPTPPHTTHSSRPQAPPAWAASRAAPR